MSLRNTVAWFEAHPAMVLGLAVVSFVTFVGTLLLVPFLLRKMPADYFVGRRPNTVGDWPAPLRWGFRVLKNVLGWVVIAMGVLMLFLPGQGVLTIVLGIVLIDFPAKRRIERWLVARPKIRRSIDWIRQRGGQPPLVLWERRTGDAEDQTFSD